jgi:hypothetical protein
MNGEHGPRSRSFILAELKDVPQSRPSASAGLAPRQRKLNREGVSARCLLYCAALSLQANSSLASARLVCVHGRVRPVKQLDSYFSRGWFKEAGLMSS